MYIANVTSQVDADLRLEFFFIGKMGRILMKKNPLQWTTGSLYDYSVPENNSHSFIQIRNSEVILGVTWII